MAIKLILVFALIALGLYVVRRMGSVHIMAWKRIAFAGFILFGIVSVVHPAIIDTFAKKIGIGRGADLLLYTLVVTFLFVTINFYLKFRKLELRQGKIISNVALVEKEIKK
jgi:hypothetical protein